MLDELADIISTGLVERTLSKCSRWCEKRLVLPEPMPGPFNFHGFEFQREILDSTEPQITIRKAAQVGFSIVSVAKTLHRIEQKTTDSLYILPTALLAGDFSKARLANILQLSPNLRNLFHKSNSVGLKIATNGSSLYIRGSVSEAGLVSMPIGFVCVDEYDRCNTKTLALVAERMANFKDRQLLSLSTPTLPDWGIDELYKKGDQRHFFFPCPHCGRHIELTWDENVVVRGETPTDIRCNDSHYICHKCKHEITHEEKMLAIGQGEWVIGNTAVVGHASYHINQLYHPVQTAPDLVRAYFEGQQNESKRVEFENQKKGMPFLLEGATISDQMIQDCIGMHRKSDPRPKTSGRMICMGVDVGSYLDVTIVEFIYTRDPGNEPHLNSIARVLFEGRFAGSDWDILSHLMSEWQVQYSVVDSQPEQVKATEFARKFNRYAALARYREGTTGTEIKTQYDDNRVPFLTVDRTAFMDLALRRFHQLRIELPIDVSESFKEHIKAPCRTYELNAMGNPEACYKSRDKADHLAHALVFAEIAHLMAYGRSTGRNMKVGESWSNI